MSATPSLPAARRATPVGWLLSRVVWRTRVVGAEHMPAEGPVIVAANHTGVIDGPIVFGVSPRPVHMMIKESMFRGPIGSFLPTAISSRPLSTRNRPKKKGDCTRIGRHEENGLVPSCR